MQLHQRTKQRKSFCKGAITAWLVTIIPLKVTSAWMALGNSLSQFRFRNLYATWDSSIRNRCYFIA